MTSRKRADPKSSNPPMSGTARRVRRPRPIGTYYFWKWADNDVPGRPEEVISAFLKGKMHPSVQTFDANPLNELLSRFAEKGRRNGEEWDWRVSPDGSLESVAFLFATCPELKKSGRRNWKFVERFYPLDLSGFDENRGRLIEFALPKLNALELGQFPDEEHNDITEDDLPVLLRRIRHDEPDATAILVDRRNHYVQCCAFEGRYTLEWRENHDFADFSKFDQWRVGYPPEVETGPGRRIRRKFIPGGTGSARLTKGVWQKEEADARKHELICFSDVLRIFQAFLGGHGPPAWYCWKNINHELIG